jgi:hypothetical protein
VSLADRSWQGDGGQLAACCRGQDPWPTSIHSQRLYRPEAGQSFSNLDLVMASRSIDWELIEHQLYAMLKHAVALKRGMADAERAAGPGWRETFLYQRREMRESSPGNRSWNRNPENNRKTAGFPGRFHPYMDSLDEVARQSCARPPSTATSLAVMKLLSDDARKAATAPISAGSAMRWSGVIEP